VNAERVEDGSLRGYGHAVLSAFWSAVMIVVSKWVMTDIDPISLAALIMFIGAVAVAAWMAARRGWACLSTLRGQGWKWSLGLSALFFFVIISSLYAIRMMDPTVVAFVSRVETLVAILLGVWFFGERFTRREAIGAAFVVIGVVALRYAGGIAIERGFWIILFASIGFGIAEALAKKTVSIVDPFAFALVRNIVLGIACFAVAMARPSGLSLPQDGLGWLAVAGIGVSGPFLGRVHFLKALQMIHISKTALVNQALPIWVALLSFFLLNTVPSQREWLGGAAVILGCVLLILGRGRPARDLEGRDSPARTG
jgi:drug/metabolite transporter (DMT)-like permease